MRIGEKYKDGRYVVLRKLGWGHFSTVWLVDDTKSGVQAALKVDIYPCTETDVVARVTHSTMHLTWIVPVLTSTTSLLRAGAEECSALH